MSVVGRKVRVSYRLTFECEWNVAFEGVVQDIVPSQLATLLIEVSGVRAPTPGFSTSTVPGEIVRVCLTSDVQVLPIGEWSDGKEWIT